MPFGTVIDPIYASATSDQIVGYTRAGDSALWTGAYLAAESFRYSVTHSADALANVKAALAGMKSLVDVTGDNRLARCIISASSPYAAGIKSEEANNTPYSSPPWVWIDNTSRDQVVGAFFGLGVAYDLVDDAEVKAGASDLVTRLIGFVSRHQWSPNDDILNTFLVRPEQLQMLLQVARHVNPSNTVSGPFLVPPVNVGVTVDVQSNSSYFKFNLAYMTFYHLLRLQNNSSNNGAYRTIRDYTASHQNAFFNLIDRGLQGPNAQRDAETRVLLDQWLKRPRRDPATDLTNVVKVCGDAACDPVPVPLRPPTDFLWQRSPFQLQLKGGSSVIEGAGVDYILPYWMARYYGVIQGAAVQSSAAPNSSVAPGSLASLYGTDLAGSTASASVQPLPTTLGGVIVSVRDVDGQQRNAELVYVSPTQINFVVPAGTKPGAATLTVLNGTATQTASATIQQVAPTLFTMNGTGAGVAAATAVAVPSANPTQQSSVPVYQCTAGGCAALPIVLSEAAPVYVTLYGTGIRNRSSLASVNASINGMSTQVLYAGPAPGFTGLDQINVALPLGLRGSNDVKVAIVVDGLISNLVTLNIK